MSMLIVDINKIKNGSGVESVPKDMGMFLTLFHSNADKPQLFNRFFLTNVVQLYQQSQQMQNCIFVFTLQTKFENGPPKYQRAFNLLTNFRVNLLVFIY